MSEITLNETRVQRLTLAIGAAIRNHYRQAGEVHAGVTLEVLNALGIMAGTTLAGTCNDEDARKFLNRAVKESAAEGMRKPHVATRKGRA